MTKPKRFQKIISLLIVFVLFAIMVSGCSLFTRDVGYYNNMVVASVGSDIKITKLQLIQAYNSFGYQYEQNGMSKKDAMQETLKTIIDREIVVQISIDNFSTFPNKTNDDDLKAYEDSLRGKSGMQGLYYQALNDDEKASVRKSVFDAMDASLKSLVSTVRTERGQTDTTSSADTSTDSASSDTPANAYTPYSPYILRNANNTSFSLDISKYATREPYYIPDPSGALNADGSPKMICIVPDTWTPKVRAGATAEQKISEITDPTEKAIAEEAYTRLIRNLRNNEKGLKFSNNEDSDVLARAIDTLIEGYSKDTLYGRLQQCFDQGISKPIDRSSPHFANLVKQYGGDEEQAYYAAVAESGSDISPLVNQVVQYYKDQTLTQINSYQKGLETDASLGSKVISGLADIYWLPNSIIDNYFTVSHILIGYSDAQTAEITKKKDEVASGKMSADAYQAWLDSLVVTAKEHDADGKETGVTKTAQEVLDELNSKLTPLNEANAQSRINTFRDYIYKYNTDPGMLNNEFEYVMGVNDSQMVQQFTDASRVLYGYKKVQQTDINGPVLDSNNKPVYNWVKDSTKTPVRSAMSQLVMTDYGAHIIMYTRPLRDFISTSTSLTNNNYEQYLYGTENSYGTLFNGAPTPAKTYFDSIADKLTKPAYTSYEQSIIATYKQQKSDDGKDSLLHIVTTYIGNYKDLF